MEINLVISNKLVNYWLVKCLVIGNQISDQIIIFKCQGLTGVSSNLQDGFEVEGNSVVTLWRNLVFLDEELFQPVKLSLEDHLEGVDQMVMIQGETVAVSWDTEVFHSVGFYLEGVLERIIHWLILGKILCMFIVQVSLGTELFDLVELYIGDFLKRQGT